MREEALLKIKTNYYRTGQNKFSHTVGGVHINTMTTTFGNINMHLSFLIDSYLFFFINIHAIFVMGQGGVILLRKGVVNCEEYILDVFPNVVVHCIDIYAEHRTKTVQLYNCTDLLSRTVTIKTCTYYSVNRAVLQFCSKVVQFCTSVVKLFSSVVL